jgi:hypothetical protein
MKIDYDDLEKAKEIWKRVDEFDKQWLSTRGVFNIMHRVGLLNDEDHKEILERYDEMMAPVTKATNEAKAYVADPGASSSWGRYKSQLLSVVKDRGLR